MKRCVGCEEELAQAYNFQQKHGLYLADSWTTNIEDRKKHFRIMMLTDNGSVLVW